MARTSESERVLLELELFEKTMYLRRQATAQQCVRAHTEKKRAVSQSVGLTSRNRDRRDTHNNLEQVQRLPLVTHIATTTSPLLGPAFVTVAVRLHTVDVSPVAIDCRHELWSVLVLVLLVSKPAAAAAAESST